ncbi:MAG TPA: VanZ family protein [Candidatus Omnitrophota bacterium]|nr:VanZ family protein [Candidatus Omnitrophota bacterium]
MAFLSRDEAKKRFFPWAPAGMLAFGILFFSLLPYKLKADLQPDHFDKVLHFAAYGSLAFLSAWGIKSSGVIPSFKNTAFALILIIGYGILIELFQSFVPGRETCLYDALFNSGGAAAGLYFGRLVLWRK